MGFECEAYLVGLLARDLCQGRFVQVPIFDCFEVMVFGLAHGTYRGTMQLVCAASGYIGALLAFMRTDLPNNWTQDLIRHRLKLEIYDLNSI